VKSNVAKPTPYGPIATKDHPDSPRKIDAAVAAFVAYAWLSRFSDQEILDMAFAMFGAGSFEAVREWRRRLGRAGPRTRRGRLARRPPRTSRRR
jgi:hypothetical protein